MALPGSARHTSGQWGGAWGGWGGRGRGLGRGLGPGAWAGGEGQGGEGAKRAGFGSFQSTSVPSAEYQQRSNQSVRSTRCTVPRARCGRAVLWNPMRSRRKRQRVRPL